jgi:putative transposase
MPWRYISPLDPKTPVIADDLGRTRSMPGLCTLYVVSRQPGDTWSDRSLTTSPPSLEDRSRQPFSSPKQTPQHVVEALIELRQHHASWGAKNRLARRQTWQPSWPLPARSTVCAIVSRHGLVPKARHRRHLGHLGQPTSQILAPNAVWSAACEGYYTTGDGL